MTDLDIGRWSVDPSKLPTLPKEWNAIDRSGVRTDLNTPLYQEPSQADYGFWDTAFYYLGKPEEWLTKTIGNIFSDDPKYNFGTGRPGDQVLFPDLLGDSFEYATGDRFPLTSAILGLGMAIVNPLDPLNKLKIAGLTKKGVALERLAHLRKNILTKEFFVKGADDIVRLDETALQSAYLKASKAVGATEDADDATKVAARLQRDQLSKLVQQRKTLNEYLEAAQKEGMTIDDIGLAKDRHTQYAQGQRRMFGLTSPLRFDQLSLFRGAAHDPFMDASGSLTSLGFSDRISPIASEVDASISKTISNAGSFAKKFLQKGGQFLEDTLDYKQVGEKYRPAVQKIDRALQSVELDMRKRHMLIIDAIREARDAGIHPVEMNNVMKAFYDQFRNLPQDQAELLWNALKKAADDMSSYIGPHAVPSIEKGAKKIKVVDEDYIAGALSDLHPRTGEHIMSSSELSRAEIDEAINTWAADGPATKVGVRRGKISPRHIILDKGDGVDRDVLRALREVEGAVSYEVTDIPLVRSTKAVAPKYTPADLREPFLVAGSLQATKEGGAAAAAKMQEVTEYLLTHPRFGLEVVAKEFNKLDPARSVEDWTSSLRSEWGDKIDMYDRPLKYQTIHGGQPDLRQSYLVGRKPHGTKKAIDPIDPNDITGVVVGPEHIRDMEVLASQLTMRGLVLDGRMNVSDFLFTEEGLAYLINPDIVQKAKEWNGGKVLKAMPEKVAQVNKTQIQRFQNRFGVGIPIGEPSILDSKSTVQRLNRQAKNARYTRTNFKPAVEGQGEFKYNAYQLLREANNTAFHEALVYAPDQVMREISAISPTHRPGLIEDANRITERVNEINQAKAVGGELPVPPIEVAVDELGRLQIVRGRNDLVAAVLADVPIVNVKASPITAEVVNKDRLFITPGMKLEDVFRNNTDELAAAGLPPVAGIHPDYKISIRGKYHALTEKDLVSLAPRGEGVIENVAHVFSKELHQVVGRNKRSNLMAKMRSGPTRNVADLAISRLIKSSENLLDLQKKLNDTFGQNFFLHESLWDPNNGEAISRFEALHRAADDYLDSLAKRGVFLPETINTERVGLYEKGVLEIYDAESKTLRIVSTSQTVEDLTEYANSALNRITQAEDIIPYYRIALEGADGAEVKEVADFYRKDMTKLADQLQQNRDLRVPDSEKKRLKGHKIALNPKKGDTLLALQDGRPMVHNPKSLVDRGYPEVQYKKHAFYFGEYGGFFVDTRQNSAHNVAKLFDTVFGEARVPRGDFGYITPQKVVIHYALSEMPEFSRLEFNKMRYRLNYLAKQFVEAGYNDGLKVEVLLPFDPYVGKKLFKEDMTLGEMASKLKAGKDNDSWVWLKDLEGAQRATGVDDVPVIYKVARKGEGFPYDNPIYKIAEKYSIRMDDLRLTEIAKGLPIRFRSSYLPRVKTPAAEQAIAILRDETYRRYNTRTSGLRNIEDFMKERTLPELTTPELNELINRLRKVQGDNITTTSEWNDIVKQVGEKDAAKLSYLSSLMNDAGVAPNSPFFYEDVYLAELSRVQASGEARRRQTLVEGLKEHGAILTLSKKDLAGYKAARGSVARLEEQASDLASQVQEAERALVEAQNGGLHGTADLAKMESAVNKLRTKHGEVVKKLGEAQESTANVYQSAQTFDIDLDTPIVYVKSEDARQLIYQNKLSVEDVGAQMESGLVALPSGKLVSSLPDDTELIFFPKEALGLVEHFVGSNSITSGRGGKLLKLFDQVQDVWRSWTLFPIPAYHARNFIGNAFLSWLGNVLNIDSLRDSSKLMSALRRFKRGKLDYDGMLQAMKDTAYVDTFGNRTTAFDLWQHAVEEGVFTGGLHYNEFRKMNRLTLNEYETVMQEMGALPSSEMATSFLLDNKLLRKGRSLGQGLENWFRLSAFIETWKKTGDFQEAGLAVKKIFYDYRDLSMFERRVLRRAFPFYSWSRFNIPRMIETMFTRPVTHYRIGELFRNWERQANGGAPVDESGLPDWVKDRFGIVVERSEDGTYSIRTLDTLIPAYEAYGFFAGIGPKEKVWDLTVNSLTPIAKLPWEAIFNKSLYTGRELEEVAGQPARGFLYSQLGMTRKSTTEGSMGVINLLWNEHFVKGTMRPVDFITRYIDFFADDRNLKSTKPAVGTILMDAFLGRSYAVDPHRVRNAMYKDWKKTERTFLNQIKWARQNNDEVSETLFLDKLNLLRATKPPGTAK